jgi:hypothetical protein
MSAKYIPYDLIGFIFEEEENETPSSSKNSVCARGKVYFKYLQTMVRILMASQYYKKIKQKEAKRILLAAFCFLEMADLAEKLASAWKTHREDDLRGKVEEAFEEYLKDFTSSFGLSDKRSKALVKLFKAVKSILKEFGETEPKTRKKTSSTPKKKSNKSRDMSAREMFEIADRALEAAGFNKGKIKFDESYHFSPRSRTVMKENLYRGKTSKITRAVSELESVLETDRSKRVVHDRVRRLFESLDIDLDSNQVLQVSDILGHFKK